MKMIKDLQINDKVQEHYFIKKLTKGLTQQSKAYYSMVLQDKSGVINAMLWDIKNDFEANIVEGEVYKFDITVGEYQSKKQAKITSITLKDDDLDMSNYVRVSPINKTLLQSYIRENIESINNIKIKEIVVEIFNKYHEDFFKYPAAASIHHDYLSGLATHVTTMLKLANAVCDIYLSINRDYLIAGVLLHDFGKIFEIESYTSGKYSFEGKLIGHISIMQSIVYDVAKQLGYENDQETILLRHMILSHHGQKEFGSPILPLTLEAQVLAYIDNMDAKINTIEKSLEGAKENEFSNDQVFLSPIDKRNFFKV